MSTHDHNIDYKNTFTKEDLENSQVKLTGELPYEALAPYREKAVKHLGKDVKLDGFRQGHIPTDVLEKHLGEMQIVTEMADRLQQKAAQNAEGTEADVTDVTDLPTPESEATKQDEAEFDPEKVALPALTDEYVKGLGQPGQFETVDDFKQKIREHLAIEKEREVTTTHRAKLTDAIIAATDFTIPPVLIDAELKQMVAQMEDELSRSNLKMDDYLSHIKKTREELMEEWKPAAEKRAKLQLVLNKIAEKEAITPDEKLLDGQVEELMKQYKDANKNAVRVYVASVMTNEAVMKLLEEQS
jgi:FKBP-type peptidyl-prolyl cis-trans isomerase (trigger factor)